MATSAPHYSAVNEFGPATSDQAITHFERKLRLEVDPADVHFDLEKGIKNFAVLDTRSAIDFEREHIPGAINIPHRKINAETTRDLPRDQIIVAYCWGTACNASTKGALNLARLGFKVKELVGGIEGWKSDGFATSSGR